MICSFLWSISLTQYSACVEKACQYGKQYDARKNQAEQPTLHVPAMTLNVTIRT